MCPQPAIARNAKPSNVLRISRGVLRNMKNTRLTFYNYRNTLISNASNDEGAMSARTVTLDRISRLARAMEIVTGLGILLVVALGVLAFVIPDWTRNLLLAKLGQVGAALPVTPAARLAAAAVVAVPLAVKIG